MTVNINGLELYYERIGEGGHSLVMLHGNGEDGTIFAPLAAKLSKHYTVYLLDSRNHGKSGRNEDFSYEAMSDDLIGFVKELNLDTPYVVGFSDGAIISIKAQLSQPGLFGKMALLGANLCPSDFREEVYLEMEVEYGKYNDPLLNLMLTQPHIDPFQLVNINVPVLVVGAENDIFKPETFVTITDALGDARMKFMYGHDHGSYVLGNDILYRPLHDFFCI